MDDSSKSEPVNAVASEPSSLAAARPAREPVARRIYVTMRLEEIGLRIVEMAKERERLTSVLKSPLSADGSSHRQLRQRRAYVAMRIDILRKEQADLNVEKRANGPVTSPTGDPVG